MHRLLLPVFLICALTLPLSTFAQEANPAAMGHIEGRLTEVAGQPLPGANLVLIAGDFQRGTSTDERGRFAFGDVPSGSYQLTISMIGYETETTTVTVRAGSTTEFDLTLEEAAYGMDEVVVSTTRMSTPLMAASGAVSVLEREAIEAQQDLADGLADMLGKAVPGLAGGIESMSNHGQTLRGRDVAVLIDGVPLSTARSVSRELATIDPSMIERVEVLRGATALYGDGATGGVINLITKSAGALRPQFTTDIGLDASLASFGDGLGGRITQSAVGSVGGFDYTASASYSEVGNYYDAEGDLMTPDPHGQGGLPGMQSWDLFGKAAYNFGAQRLQLSANYYQGEQQTEYTPDPTVEDEPAGTKSRAVAGLELSEPQGGHNAVASLDYMHEDLWGSQVKGQLYWRDYLTRFGASDRRSAGRGVSQSFLDSKKLGGRLEIETPLGGTHLPTLLWGADYTAEETFQALNLMDEDLYEESGGRTFIKVGEKDWVPTLRPRTLALFTQLSWDVAPRLTVRGGMRYERARLHVDDFTTVHGVDVEGGDLAYDPVLFNASGVFHTTDQTRLYASFSQGFSMADVGRVLRGAPEGFTMGDRTLDAQKVNNYEVGARGFWERVEASLAAYYNTSDLGYTYSGIDFVEVVRAPERVYGVEATLDLHPAQRLDVGGTFSWVEGDYDPGEDGDYIPLDGYRIPPVKLTGYVQHETQPGWTNRLQVLHSGQRDRAYEALEDKSDVQRGTNVINAFTVVDFRSQLELGTGTITLGISNLLNTEYFSVMSQLSSIRGNRYYVPGRGRAVSLGYSITY